MPSITITLDLREARILRHAIAMAADRGLLELDEALSRMCEIEALRLEAEESGGTARVVAHVKRKTQQSGRRAA